MTIINWKGDSYKFFFKGTANNMLKSFEQRGYKVTNKYTALDGTTYITVK